MGFVGGECLGWGRGGRCWEIRKVDLCHSVDFDILVNYGLND